MGVTIVGRKGLGSLVYKVNEYLQSGWCGSCIIIYI